MPVRFVNFGLLCCACLLHNGSYVSLESLMCELEVCGWCVPLFERRY
jgi:hypothetical protein